MSEVEPLTYALAFVALFFAAGAGIGGGGLLVPLYILAGGFGSYEAVPLSNVTILGGAVANFAINVCCGGGISVEISSVPEPESRSQGARVCTVYRGL